MTFGRARGAYTLATAGTHSSAAAARASARYALWAAVAVCAALSLTASLLQGDPPRSGTGLDDSWQMGLAQAYAQGEISGRDLIATYGWLYQVLTRAAVLLHAGHSVFDLLPLLGFLLKGCATLLLAACLLLIDRIGWKMATLVFAVLDYAHLLTPAAVRSFTALLAMVVLYRATRAASPGQRRLLAAACGLLCLAAQLLTFEMGVYAAAGALLALPALACASHWRLTRAGGLLPAGEYLRLAGVVAAVFMAGNVAVGAIFHATAQGNSPISYPAELLDLMRGYTRALASPWLLPPAATVAWLLLIFYVAGFVAVNVRRLHGADLSLFSCLLGFAICLLKAVTIRSDVGHIAFGSACLLICFLLTGRRWTDGWRPRWLWAALLVAFLALWPPAGLDRAKAFLPLLEGDVGLRHRFSELRYARASAAVVLPQMLTGGGNRGRGLLIFPYQNYLAVAAGRRLVAPVIQSYQATTPALQRTYCERLAARRDDTQVLYALDGVVSVALDGVQNVSRTPRIFDCLYRGYHAALPPAGGYVLLIPRPAPAALSAEALAFSAAPLAAAAAGPAHAADPYPDLVLQRPAACALVRIGLQVGYPPLTFLGRPSPIELQLLAQGRSVGRAKLFALEEGKLFTTYVSLVEPGAFGDIFVDGAHVAGRSFDRLSFAASDDSLFAFRPATLAVRSLECIRF
jgi:hypothetical protein